MQKKWLLLPLIMFIFLGIDKSSAAAETILEQLVEEERSVCQEMSAAEKKEIALIASFMEEDDSDGLLTHLNQQVLASKEQLEVESNLKKYVKCPAIKADDRELAGKMALYEQFLNYSERLMEDEESLEIKEMALERNRNETAMYHMEVTFNKNKTVTMNYFYGVTAWIDYDRYESKEMERILEDFPMFIAFIHLELVEPMLKVIKNPLEKGADLVANYLEEKKDVELARKVGETKYASSILNMEFAITEGELGVWEDPYQAQQLYPIYSTYSVLERWEEVHGYNPDFPYPEKDAQEKKWDNIMDFFEKHQSEISHDAYEYIFANYLRGTVEKIAKDGVVEKE